MVLFCREAISRLCEAVPGANGAIKKRKLNIDVVFLFYVTLTMGKIVSKELLVHSTA